MNANQEIYKHLFDNSGEGMLVTNDRGIIEEVNPSLLELFGYEKSELVGQRIEILVPSSAKEKHTQQREGYTQHPKKRRMGGDLDLTGKRKDGSVFPVEIGLSYSNINNEKKITAIVTDITERIESSKKLKHLNKILEEKVTDRTIELEKSKKLYDLISRNFPRGIISVFDKNLTYVFTEGQELDRIGLTSQELIGEKYTKRYTDKIEILVKEKLSELFKGRALSFEYENNGVFYVVNAVPLKTRNNKVEQVLFIEKNITDSILAQQKLQNNLDREIELNEMKSRFVSMASHEFRTPLSTIMSSASLAGKYTKEEDQNKREKHINRIQSSVKNLTSILNDFLSIDKLEDGKIQITESDFLLLEVTEEVMDEMEFFLKQGQKIILKTTVSAEQMVVSDRNVFKNILINLLSNASKYSPKESNITLSIQLDNNGVIIDIKDEGIGIPKKEQAKLFNSRFFRAGNVTNIEGTGLGLTIVKKYLSLINGEISFKSEETKGSTFTIKIPNILI
ncbi:MAG: PAS domain-containing sensor histidine kinase [Vicingaceae bacterium]